MNDTPASRIATRAAELAGTTPARVLIAIAGPPGSGKSTLAEAVVQALTDAGHAAALVPMDGFHLDNATLQARGRLARKGAPDTFDAAGFVTLLQMLKAGGPVAVPVFDRAQDRVIPAAAQVPAATRICVVEGNYLMLDQAPWSAASSLWDYSVFLDVAQPELERRLIRRWRDHGLDAAAAQDRVEGNDLPNAVHVLTHSRPCDLHLVSDPSGDMSFSPHQGSG